MFPTYQSVPEPISLWEVIRKRQCYNVGKVRFPHVLQRAAGGLKNVDAVTTSRLDLTAYSVAMHASLHPLTDYKLRLSRPTNCSHSAKTNPEPVSYTHLTLPTNREV